MGTSAGEDDDLGLFIPGAVNLSLGKEAAEGCDASFLGQYEKGLARWFEHHRYVQSHDDDQCPTLNTEALSGIHKLAREVIASTHKNDVIVFLGQTPAYIYPLVKPHRQSTLIAISRTKPAKTIEPDAEQLQHFCKYLESEGLSSDVLKSKNLVLVDHSYHGNAIEAITKTFNSCAKANNTIKFRFINFASEQQLAAHEIAPLDNHRFIQLEKVLNCSYLTMRAIAKKDILPRLISDYPCEDWLSPPPSVDNAETKACVEKVEKFGLKELSGLD
ncbi:MAG: hypothetical protein HRU09_09910 [Oligoflexales bacterium]|nr:hypothetical protein [Oligoflexales bacterium]